MWVSITCVPFGNPDRLNTNVAVAAVMVPAESRVRFNVNVPVPRPLASALVTGGTSFAGFSAAVKLIVFGGPDGVVGLLLPQPAASNATTAIIANLFILVSP